jgi:hypothetical protein
VEATRFDRGRCQAKPTSGFRIRQPLQFAQQSNGTQTFPKAKDGLGQNGKTSFFGVGLFRDASLAA